MSGKNKAVVTINKNKVKVTSKTTTAKVSTSTVSNSTSNSNTSKKAVVSVTNPKVVIGGVDNGSRTTIDGSLKYTGGNEIEVTNNNIINFIGDSAGGWKLYDDFDIIQAIPGNKLNNYLIAVASDTGFTYQYTGGTYDASIGETIGGAWAEVPVGNLTEEEVQTLIAAGIAAADTRTQIARFRDTLQHYSAKEFDAEDADGNIAFAKLFINGKETIQTFTTEPTGTIFSGGFLTDLILKQVFEFEPVIKESWTISLSPLYEAAASTANEPLIDGEDADDLSYDEDSGLLTSNNDAFTYVEPNLINSGE